MKGGVTSGIVYPPAICELATRFSFRNIGGTSIGAVAAALAAAAEYGRRRGIADTFVRLSAFPQELSVPGTIAKLLEPDAAAKPVFAPASALAFEARPRTAAVPVALARLIKYFGAAAALVPAGVLAVAAVMRALGWGAGPAYWFFASAVALLLFAFVVGARYVRALISVLSANRFGLVSGHADGADSSERFSDWLERQLQELSDHPKDRPLTFRDLCDAPRNHEPIPLDEPVINLVFVSTNVTHESPYRIPFDIERVFFYDPDEWKTLFSREVLDWLRNHAREGIKTVVNEQGKRLIPLPMPKDLPVIVGARLSLGVPLLFTAVPLYAVDFTRKKEYHSKAAEEDKAALAKAEKVWFVDGGVCANFPIHLFDAPIPRWPTFGINLKAPHPDHKDKEIKMVWLPNDTGPFPVVWNRCEETSDLGIVGWFLTIVANTAIGWRDALQTRMPGFRERVVHISQGRGEGGFNLSMTPGIVEKLACRGTCAGRLLRDRFRWDNHVWIRLRSYLAAQETAAVSFSTTFSELEKISRVAWAAAVNRPPGVPPNYHWPPDQGKLKQALDAVDQLSAAFKERAQQPDALQENSPTPRPRLRMSPDF